MVSWVENVSAFFTRSSDSLVLQIERIKSFSIIFRSWRTNILHSSARNCVTIQPTLIFRDLARLTLSRLCYDMTLGVSSHMIGAAVRRGGFIIRYMYEAAVNVLTN